MDINKFKKKCLTNEVIGKKESYRLFGSNKFEIDIVNANDLFTLEVYQKNQKEFTKNYKMKLLKSVFDNTIEFNKEVYVSEEVYNKLIKIDKTISNFEATSVMVKNLLEHQNIYL